MNIKLFTILAITSICFTTSSCGMKRALSLPKEDKKATSALMYEQLASHQPIDVLKVNR